MIEVRKGGYLDRWCRCHLSDQMPGFVLASVVRDCDWKQYRVCAERAVHGVQEGVHESESICSGQVRKVTENWKSRQRLTLGIVEVVRAEDLDCLWVDKLVSDGDVQHGFSTTIGLRDGS